VILLENDHPPILGNTSSTMVSDSQVVNFEVVTPTSITIKTNTSQEGYLVIAINRYPGWVCSLDEKIVPTYRANGICNAVFVPHGSHQLLYKYQPSSFQTGKLISWITACLMILLSLCLLRLKRGNE